MRRELWVAGLSLVIAGCGGVGRGAKEPAAPEPTPVQPLTPVDQINAWLNGFHVMKDDATHIAEVNHYCDVLNSDLIQCVLYDTTRPDARLVGVEYIIPEVAFEGLPSEEQAYWHPHNYEILSGALAAPVMAEGQEQALMRSLLNSYGKTWHTWEMGTPLQSGPPLPTGDARLSWSFNAAGELPEALIRSRDDRLGVDSEALREERRPLVREAHPQEGVDAMRDQFPNRRPFPGVQEKTPRRGPGTR